MGNNVKEFLLGAVEKIKTIEKKAKQAIEKENDLELYRGLMRQKAEYLASLPEEAKTTLVGEPNLEVKQKIERMLENFSGNASTALALNSTFYMSALLYPDDHKEGEPNNLEILAQSL